MQWIHKKIVYFDKKGNEEKDKGEDAEFIEGWNTKGDGVAVHLDVHYFGGSIDPMSEKEVWEKVEAEIGCGKHKTDNIPADPGFKDWPKGKKTDIAWAAGAETLKWEYTFRIETPGNANLRSHNISNILEGEAKAK